MLTRADKGMFISVLLISIISLVLVYQFQRRAQASRLEVIVAAKKVASYLLSDNRMVRLRGINGSCLLEIKRGKARIKSTNCPNKICFKRGWIYQPGDSIICLPMKILVRIPLKREVTIDYVTR